MPQRSKFAVKFAPEVLDHLDVIDRRYHGLIARTINERLSLQPERETRNRKPLLQPAHFGATWEIRFGPANRFRVFYEVDSSARTVWVLAIGIKEGNQLLVGGEEFRA
jgi:mRNA-degrading endonuclease RelE of RelBE toxin-antitoxin system